MIKRPFNQSAFDLVKGLSPRARFLSALWGLFFLLVLFGIHGSSTGVTSDWWAPEKPYSGYLFSPPRSLNKSASINTAAALQDATMARARIIRWDELLIATPLALSQLSHNPRFPVVNTNIGNGQNMLLTPHAPVLHIVSLARPGTWGYFFLGAQRGLAWYWWFQVFSCFTVLYLLFEIILKGHRLIAAFGAFWYCASAYVVCWSLWPTQFTFNGALCCLTAYHILRSDNRAVQAVCAVLFGLGLTGFAITFYPAWQVPLGYLFAAIFAGLFIRDKLYLSFKPFPLYRVICLAGAFLLAGALIYSFLITSLPDLKLMSNTVYPGRRVSTGGDYPFALLFKGMYNLDTIYITPPGLINQCEAASFYYFFPAVLFAVCLSKRIRKSLGIIGWVLVSYTVAMSFFMLVGIPGKLAKLTLLSYAPPYRADIALGLSSIILCIYVLARIKEANEWDNRWERIVPWIAGAGVSVMLLLHGLLFIRKADGFPPPGKILFISILMGSLSYLLLAGKSRIFLGASTVLIVATTAFFNPLSTNLDHLYKSELAQQITRINNQSSDRPLWLCYGGVQPGTLVTVLGGRSLSSTHWPPQIAMWRSFDKTGVFDPLYNRYAQVNLIYTKNENEVAFLSRQDDALMVHISPKNPIVRSMGARYVLAMGDVQNEVKEAGLRRLYESTAANFSIFEIPQSNGP